MFLYLVLERQWSKHTELFSFKRFPVIGTATSEEGVNVIDGFLSELSGESFGINLISLTSNQLKIYLIL